jgi:hypothetical protein
MLEAISKTKLKDSLQTINGCGCGTEIEYIKQMLSDLGMSNIEVIDENIEPLID